MAELPNNVAINRLSPILNSIPEDANSDVRCGCLHHKATHHSHEAAAKAGDDSTAVAHRTMKA
jgi:hypothetical protein